MKPTPLRKTKSNVSEAISVAYSVRTERDYYGITAYRWYPLAVFPINQKYERLRGLIPNDHGDIIEIVLSDPCPTLCGDKWFVAPNFKGDSNDDQIRERPYSL